MSDPVRLPHPTRGYVALGLVLVVALALALWSWLHQPDAPTLADLDEVSELELEHRAWNQLERRWPGPLSGSLGGAWERVQAAPVLGGVLIERRPVVIAIERQREPSLRVEPIGELSFVPRDALESGGDPIAARRPCEGLPTTFAGELSVAPDGRSLVLREQASDETVLIYRFVEVPAGTCKVEPVGKIELGDWALGKSNAAGRMTWSYDDDMLWWWDRHGRHGLHLYGISRSSGPWWLDDEVLAVLGERSLGEAEDYRLEPIVTLLRTGVVEPDDSQRAPRIVLDLHSVFPGLLPDDPAANLLDLRPAGRDGLILLTEQCPAGRVELVEPRPCVHRARLSTSLGPSGPSGPLLERLGSVPLDAAIVLEPAELVTITLGAIGPYDALAISGDGRRAAWTGVDPREPEANARLYTAELGDQEIGEVQRLDADPIRELTPRISADGRVIVVESPVVIETLGSIPSARAFVL